MDRHALSSETLVFYNHENGPHKVLSPYNGKDLE